MLSSRKKKANEFFFSFFLFEYTQRKKSSSSISSEPNICNIAHELTSAFHSSPDLRVQYFIVPWFSRLFIHSDIHSDMA